MKNKKTSSILDTLLEHVPKDPTEEEEEEENEDEEDEQIAFLNPEKVKKFQHGFKKSTSNIG